MASSKRRPEWYILEGDIPVPFQKRFTKERLEQDIFRCLAVDNVTDPTTGEFIRIETYFTAQDSAEEGPPQLWATYIKDGKRDWPTLSYHSMEQARVGHAKAVETVELFCQNLRPAPPLTVPPNVLLVFHTPEPPGLPICTTASLEPDGSITIEMKRPFLFTHTIHIPQHQFREIVRAWQSRLSEEEKHDGNHD